MSTVDEFRDLLPFSFDGESLSITQWAGTTRRSSHLLGITSQKNHIVLYIKESNKTPGFWGLTKNQLDRLNKSQVRWFAVLLLKSNDSGYVLSSDEVDSSIQDGTFELSNDGDHKINEGTDLNADMAFRGIKNLLTRVFNR